MVAFAGKEVGRMNRMDASFKLVEILTFSQRTLIGDLTCPTATTMISLEYPSMRTL